MIKFNSNAIVLYAVFWLAYLIIIIYIIITLQSDVFQQNKT